jgi:integrase/recombinase XerC
LRKIQSAPKNFEADWLSDFITSLREEDLSPATVRGYCYDLDRFFQWIKAAKGTSGRLEKLTTMDLINYRQYLINVVGLKPATVNRRLEALRRLCRWAYQTQRIKNNVAQELKPVRFARNVRPLGLTEPEVHALLRVAGESGHGLATRNYALVQLMLQTGLRVSEVAALKLKDVVARERSGFVRIRQGKGFKEREIPLNATARRALCAYMAERKSPDKPDAFFLSDGGGPMPTRTIQAVITQLGKRAKITRVGVSAHTLRHTFALNYLKQNPGKLVELATLLGHESLDTTAIYTRPSSEDLAQDLERSRLNIYG